MTPGSLLHKQAAAHSCGDLLCPLRCGVLGERYAARSTNHASPNSLAAISTGQLKQTSLSKFTRTTRIATRSGLAPIRFDRLKSVLMQSQQRTKVAADSIKTKHVSMRVEREIS